MGERGEDSKWGIGDMGDNDTELFKHLPDPKDLIREEIVKMKKKTKNKRKVRI